MLEPLGVAQELAQSASRHRYKFVIAESCSGGRAAAMLTLVPGVSNCFCGSAVTYRIGAKTEWLGIDRSYIDHHTAESPETSLAMAKAILARTPEANWSAAITGHLGPVSENTPPEKDGVVYVATAHRQPTSTSAATNWQAFKLTSENRTDRQQEAAEVLLEFLHQQW